MYTFVGVSKLLPVHSQSVRLQCCIFNASVWLQQRRSKLRLWMICPVINHAISI